MCVCVALRPAVFEIQGCPKSEKSEVHWMTSKWTWLLNSQKYFAQIEYLSPKNKFCSVLLYNKPFSRYRTFYNSPLTPLLKDRQIKKNTICQRSKMLNFIILSTTLLETRIPQNSYILPRGIYEFWGVNLMCTFRCVNFFNSLILTFQGHSRPNVIVVLNSPLMISYWCLIVTDG